MTEWQKSLDRWLTTEPHDDYTPFCEKLEAALPEPIYEKIEAEFDAAFTNKTDAPVDKIYWKLYRKDDMTPERAATIISRIYRNK